MEDQGQHHYVAMAFVAALVALAVGAFGGYYYGNAEGVKAGRRAAEDEARQAALREATGSVDIFGDSADTNPFNYENPFGSVKTNPFE